MCLFEKKETYLIWIVASSNVFGISQFFNLANVRSTFFLLELHKIFSFTQIISLYFVDSRRISQEEKKCINLEILQIYVNSCHFLQRSIYHKLCGEYIGIFRVKSRQNSYCTVLIYIYRVYNRIQNFESFYEYPKLLYGTSSITNCII